MANNPPTPNAQNAPGAQSAQNAQNASPIPNQIGASGGLRLPRWPLLSVLFCTVILGVGDIFWYSAPCTPIPVLTLLCQANRWPTLVPILLIWLLFGLGWIGTWCFGASIQEPRAERGFTSSLLRSLSDFEALRPLIFLFGGVCLFWCLLMLVLARVQPVLFALAFILGFVAIWTRLYRPPQALPSPSTSAQAQLNQSLSRTDTALFRFRSLPLINRIWPNKP